MKKVLFCLVMIWITLFSQAQSSIALVGGIQGASVSPNFLIYPDTLQKTSSQKIGAVLGVVANISINNNLFFHTGILYSSKGSNWTQFYDTARLYARTKDLPADEKAQKLSTNTRLNVSYIDVPLNLLYKFSTKGKSSFFLGAGPQVSIFYNGNTYTNNISVSQDGPSADRVRLYFKESQNNDLPVGKTPGKYRVVHFAMNAFAGIEFTRIFLNVNYNQDLNAFYEEEGRQYKNTTIGFKLGVFLGRRKASSPSKHA